MAVIVMTIVVPKAHLKRNFWCSPKSTSTN